MSIYELQDLKEQVRGNEIELKKMEDLICNTNMSSFYEHNQYKEEIQNLTNSLSDAHMLLDKQGRKLEKQAAKILEQDQKLNNQDDILKIQFECIRDLEDKLHEKDNQIRDLNIKFDQLRILLTKMIFEEDQI